LSALAAIRQRLASAATDAERVALLAELDDVLRLLDREPHRVETLALAQQVQHLDRKLADRSPAERNEIICERLGISRSRVYQLRAVHIGLDGSSV
jgi:precorrin-6B methylase 1